MKQSERERIAWKILLMQSNHSQAAIWERLCDEEPAFCREFWGEDFMESRGDQSPGYFAVCWADGVKDESSNRWRLRLT